MANMVELALSDNHKRTKRRAAKDALAGMPPEERAAASAAIRSHLDAWDVWRTAPIVLAFAPMEEEPDVLALLAGRPCALVRIPDDGGALLEFRRWDGATAFEAAPGLGNAQIGADAALIDPGEWPGGLVLVPGLAFGMGGSRLGRGKGWYDRFNAHWPHLTRVGICFACQMMDGIPMDAHDSRVDWLVNEHGLLGPWPR